MRTAHVNGLEAGVCCEAKEQQEQVESEGLSKVGSNPRELMATKICGALLDFTLCHFKITVRSLMK